MIPRTLEKLIAGEDVCIHFVGDSITVGYNSTGTVGGNFVQRLGGLDRAAAGARRRGRPLRSQCLFGAIGWADQRLERTDRHPAGPTGNDQLVQVVNNGVSGDTVQRVLRRIGNLTGWTPPIDLFVILLGINDSLESDPPSSCRPMCSPRGYGR